MGERLQAGLKLKRIVFRILRAARVHLGQNRTAHFEPAVEDYRRYWEGAAQILSAEFVPLADALWEVRLNGRRTRIMNRMVQLGDPVVNGVSGDKALCYRLAMEQGVPVPQYGVFRLEELSEAKKFLAQNPGVYVVKPVRESTASAGVTTHVRTERQLENAAVSVSLFAKEFLVERMIFGETCRLLWLDGELIHAVRQRGVRVTGDGCSTIARLLKQPGSGSVPFDLTTQMTLQAQGLSPETVPEDGREILVRSLRPGRDSSREWLTVHDDEITDLVCPAIIEDVRKVLGMIGNTIAGVDIITNDPTVSLRQSGGVLLEVNPGPSIHKHYINPEDHHSHPVAVKILSYLLQVSTANHVLLSAKKPPSTFSER